MDNNDNEKRKELIMLLEKLKSAEQSRATGIPNISLDEARARIQKKYNMADGVNDYSLSQ